MELFAIAGRDSGAEFLGGGVRDCLLGRLIGIRGSVLLMGVVILVILGEY